MENPTGAPSAAETPAAPPPPMSVAEHIAAEAAAEKAAPAAASVAHSPAPTDADIEQEADSGKPDADLSDAARKLRANRKDARAAKLREDNDNLARELQRRRELRSEIDRLAHGQPATAGADRSPAGKAPALDLTDPEPTLESYAAAHPDDPDPYAGYIKAWNRWDRRQEARAAEDRRRTEAARTAVTETQRQLQARAEASRSKYADYDAVVTSLDESLGEHPSNAVITQFIASSDVGGDLAYRLGKDMAATMAAIRGGQMRLVAHLGAVESAIVAERKPPAKSVTAAPPPPSQTATGSTPATELDTRKGVSTADHIRIEEAEIAERRRRGLRY